MALIVKETRLLPISAISSKDRFITPTEAAIGRMAQSLGKVGQVTPIMVQYQTRKTYRLVVGQTRLKAAAKLGWSKIRAEIVGAEDPNDFRITEISENLARADLTAQQRKEAKAELKRLLQEKLARVEPCKGGRGKKGGLREVARQQGIPRRTARDQMTKLGGNTDSRPVSEPPPAPPAAGNGSAEPASSSRAQSPAHGTKLTKLSIPLSVIERTQTEKYNRERRGNGPLGQCIREFIREGLKKHGYWPPPEGE